MLEKDLGIPVVESTNPLGVPMYNLAKCLKNYQHEIKKMLVYLGVSRHVNYKGDQFNSRKRRHTKSQEVVALLKQNNS